MLVYRGAGLGKSTARLRALHNIIINILHHANVDSTAISLTESDLIVWTSHAAKIELIHLYQELQSICTSEFKRQNEE